MVPRHTKSIVSMATQTANYNLHKAKNAKKDEFYTQLGDIENELRHYRHHFKDKVVYCNCDDPRISNFFHYFSYNFEDLGLKKLITTCYQNQNRDLFSAHNSERSIYLEYCGDTNNNKVPDIAEIGVRPYKPKHKKFRKEIQKRGAVDWDLYMIKNAEVVVPYARILIKNKRIFHGI